MKLLDLFAMILQAKVTPVARKKGGMDCVRGDKLARAHSRSGSVYGRKVRL